MSTPLNFIPCRVSRGVRSYASGLILILTLALAFLLFPSPSSASTHIGLPGNYLTLSSGLVGYWPLDGKTINWATNTTNDVSGHGNTGTLTNMSKTTSPVAGKIGGALKFDGVNNYIDMGNPSALNITSSISVSAWIYPTASGNSLFKPIAARRVVNDGWEIYLSSAGGANQGSVSWFNGSTQFISTYIPPMNKWTFVTAIITAGGSLQLYANGAPAPSGTGSSAVPAASTGDTYIGQGDPFQSPWRFTGSIDDVRIYNRALSAQEVQALYHLGAANVAHSNTTALSSGLVGYWTFDGGTTHWNTGKVDDVSGQGNTGQLINMSTTTSPVPGKIGQALKFAAGVNQYIKTPQVITTNTFTQCAWIYPTASPADAGAAITYQGPGGSTVKTDFLYVDGLSLNTNAIFIRYEGGTWGQTPANTITKNKWNHACWVFSAGKGLVYINGVLKLTQTGMGSGAPSANNLYIGHWYDFTATSREFMGTIDDVRVYNRALSASEVQALYSMGRVRL